jgi:uncharacterized protein (DUF433 family)
VKWDDEQKTLVFHGTKVPVSVLWQALTEGWTPKDFFAAFPSVSVRTVLRIIRVAGQMLSDWTWNSREEQEATYAKALAEGDTRFKSGTIVFLPGVRGGNLLASPSLNRIDILWSYIRAGHSPDEITESFPRVTSSEVTRIVDLARQLFERGLVPNEASNLLGRGRSDSSEGTS